MSEHGYVIGNQRKGELLIKDWAKKDFTRTIKLAKSAEFFQDAPFSFPYTFQVLDHEFKSAKFILTVRRDAEQWYDSLVTFHGKRFGMNGRIPPSAEDLKSATYISKGLPYEIHKILYNTPDSNPYHKAYFIDYYNTYVNSVKDYFRHKSEKLILIDISVKEDYFRLCDFLKQKPLLKEFPWINKT